MMGQLIKHQLKVMDPVIVYQRRNKLGKIKEKKRKKRQKPRKRCL